jgi:hypothetical protein
LKALLIFLLSAISAIASAQTPRIVSGVDVTLTTVAGYNITPRTSPIALLVENSRFTKTTNTGYILQAGDDSFIEANHENVNDAVITGNYLVATVGNGSLHAIMAGYNLNYNIKYNYINGSSYGIVYEGGYNDGSPMVNTGGGIHGNIFKGNNYVYIWGFENVNIFNNTFYFSTDVWNRIRIGTSNGTDIPSPAKNVKIKNNIFYLVHNTTVMQVDAAAVEGFECDYNVYYCETGDHKPTFSYRGSSKTWEQWQALGFDTHSVVMNPNFIDKINFVPKVRLDFGTDLGEEFDHGLSINAEWVVGTHPDTVKQGSFKQVGARIYDSQVTIPAYVRSFIENDTPSRLEISYNLTLANVIPAPTAFSVIVNSVIRNVNSVTISGNKVFLTLESPAVFGDKITVAYTKPLNNPLQSPTGGQSESFNAQAVTNNCKFVANQLPVISISSPTSNSLFISPAIIKIDAIASDPDGAISKVEFFQGNIKLGESTMYPYSFTWEGVTEGIYTLSALATDNSGASYRSASVEVIVSFIDDSTSNESSSEVLNLYPNPNNGIFYIDLFLTISILNIKVTITSLSGKIVFAEVMDKEDRFKQFDLSKIATGTYIFFITYGNTILATTKFIKN